MGGSSTRLRGGVGGFERGKEADFVVVDPRPEVDPRLPRERLFSLLVFRGREGMVVATYVRGKPLYQRDG